MWSYQIKQVTAGFSLLTAAIAALFSKFQGGSF